MEKIGGLTPTVSRSVDTRAATRVVFSATAWVAAVAITGALSLASIRSTVISLELKLAPSLAVTST